MIDLDKKLTKEDFKKLLKSKYKFLIAEWYAKTKNTLTDYYISNIHKRSKKDEKLMDQNKLEIFNLLKAEELRKITKIAYENIFFVEKPGEKDYKEINLDVLKEIINLNEKSKDLNSLLRYSYLVGICALGSYLLRYHSEERSDTIEDIFNIDRSLFK